MSYPLNRDLLMGIAHADFMAWLDAHTVIMSLPGRRRLNVEFGLAPLTFEEWEAALGRRHPNDDRPIHGGMGCIG